MKTKQITSFNLQNSLINSIKDWAKEKKISAGDFVYFVFEDYQAKKEEVANLKFYLKSMQDKDYIKEQILDSEIDFQVELKNKSF